MSAVAEAAPSAFSFSLEKTKPKIRMEFSKEIVPTEAIVKRLTEIVGRFEFITFWEGERGVYKKGASFLSNQLFRPILKNNPDAKLCPYSLRGWDKRSIREITSDTSPIGEEMNKLNTKAMECIYSASFFKFLQKLPKESWLFQYINKVLQREDLAALSANFKPRGVTVEQFFEGVFDCKKDFEKAYAQLQFVEGLFLILQRVERALKEGQKNIQIVFCLPNDEGKYYLDYPQEAERVLRLYFQDALEGIEINIWFNFFQYGEAPVARPYIEKAPKKEKPEMLTDIPAFFDYIPKKV